jgi:hypothetical protein
MKLYKADNNGEMKDNGEKVRIRDRSRKEDTDVTDNKNLVQSFRTLMPTVKRF